MIIEKLNSEFYQVFQRGVTLVEEDPSANYELKVRLKSTSTNGVYINLPKIKMAAKYLQSDPRVANPPKDCDAIIIDVDSKVLYLIEMKKSSTTSTNQHLDKQLSAGMEWWNHISFCLENTNSFEVIKIAVMVEERRSRDRRQRGGNLMKVPTYDFYKILGNSLALELIK